MDLRKLFPRSARVKMENHVRAPRAGKVDQLHVAAGQTVTLHALLAEIV